MGPCELPKQGPRHETYPAVSLPVLDLFLSWCQCWHNIPEPRDLDLDLSKV